MISVLEKLKERRRFMETTLKARECEKSIGQNENVPPIFSKRLFAAGSISITSNTLKLLKKNQQFISDLIFHLNDSEMLSLSSLVNSLRFIHQNKDYIKKVISNCVTFEKLDAFECVQKWPHETVLSCYFILSGSVEATYAVDDDNVHNIFQPNIIYSHGAGEYIGLLNHEEGDLASPATLYTKLPTEFLRIDRTKFHALMDIVQKELLKEIKFYLNHQILLELEESEKLPLLPYLVKETWRSDQIIIKQDESNHFVYFVISGRCEAFRAIVVPQLHQHDNNVELFGLWTYEKGELFGEECFLFNRPSSVSVITKSKVVVLKISNDVLASPGKQKLCSLLRSLYKEYPSDETLKLYRDDVRGWQKFKMQHLYSTVNKEKAKRIKSAPCLKSQSEVKYERHLDFIEGEYRSKVATSWKKVDEDLPQLQHSKPTKNDTDDYPMPSNGEEVPKRSRFLLSKAVNQLFIAPTGSNAKPTVDARELHKKFANREVLENKMKQGWIYAAETSDEALTTNTDLMTNINVEEMILKAVQSARKQAEKVTELHAKQKMDSTFWRSALEHDLEFAKNSIAYHKFRARYIQRKLKRTTGNRKAPTIDNAFDNEINKLSFNRQLSASTQSFTIDEEDIHDNSPVITDPIRRCITSDVLLRGEDEVSSEDETAQELHIGNLSERRNAMNPASLWKGARVAGRLLRIYHIHKNK